MKRQKEYLVPLIRFRMQLVNDEEQNDNPRYIECLFNHFCDRKTNANLSCIRDEMEFMDQSLIDILFEDSVVNIGNLMVIFPNLRSYINENGGNVKVSDH